MPRRPVTESPFQQTLKGVAAGLVGTLVMTTGLQAASRLLGGSPAQRDDDSLDEAELDDLRAIDTGRQLPPQEQVAERLASRVFNRELSQESRQRIGLWIYWLYGAGWGALSAQIQLRLRPPAVPYGIITGIVVWLIGPGRIVPALRLYERPARAAMGLRVVAIGLHILYGVTTALTLDRLSPPR
ncbi:MAG: hypothetical protein IT306_14390 [Chloroflexi bacterium]|nr:hypothetical protein [Chloroflexota bacterium]